MFRAVLTPARVGWVFLRSVLAGSVLAGSVLAGTVGLAGSVLAGCSAASTTTAPTTVDVTAFLAQHAAAVRDHDRAAFAAGLDPDAGTYRSAQLAAFANLVKLPFTRWTYSLGPAVADTGAQAAARRTYGPSTRIVRVTLHYALRGVDPIPTSHDLWWTITRHDGLLVIASDSDLAADGGTSWQGPWDFGPLDIVHGRFSLVLGHPDTATLLAPLAAAVDRAVPAVTAVWGTGWTRDVAVLVPSSAAERDADLGMADDDAGGDTVDVAAVATADGQDPLSGVYYGQRVVIDATSLRALSAIGRRIVITHEVTHIADAVATTDASPRWLVEGFAEYVANLDTGQPVAVAAAELRASVLRTGVPHGLPVEADFDAGSTAAQAYEESWLACRLIARRAGQAGLVRLYRLVGSSLDPTGVASALRTVLRETPGRFIVQWRAYVAAELAR